MKKLVFILLFIPLISFGQQYFFIANQSYETTDAFYLESNSSQTGDRDVLVQFIKDKDNNKFIVLTSEFIYEAFIKDALFIYLKDGNIINISTASNYDFFDGNMVSIYKLTDDAISKITTAGINSLRYINSSSGKSATASNNSWLLGKMLKEFL
jgi:hypothetical protein|tara:strand:- start:96 stop:557 length:462 start_codon:yes stop_codon:yes gene_type:complete